MNKINPAFQATNAVLTQQSPNVPVRSAMAAHSLTPLMPPGHRLPDLGRPEVPPWRKALFDRAFDQIQQKLTDCGPGEIDVSASNAGALSVTELRECQAAARWIMAALTH